MLLSHGEENKLDDKDPSDHSNRGRVDDDLSLQRPVEKNCSAAQCLEDGESCHPNNDPDDQDGRTHLATLLSLAFCMLTHSYLLISVFPYSAFMAANLLELDEADAAQYAGFLASGFMAGRAISSVFFGRAADRYGRLTVLLVSLWFQLVFSILFGLVRRSYVVAFWLRFLLGLTNGIMQIIKTVVSEVSSKEDETRNMTFVIGMWGWGFLISPVISGLLAEPVRQYTDSDWIQSSDFLRTFPFILPNLLGAFLCFTAIVSTNLHVKETLPENERRSIFEDLQTWKRQHLGIRYQPIPLSKSDDFDQDFGLDEEGDRAIVQKGNTADNGKEVTSMMSLMSRPQTRKCLVISWLYSFVSLTVDECFPLFCLSHTAGFGLSEKEIGKILSLCGLIFAFCQYSVYKSVYDRFGLYGGIKMSSCLSAPLLLLIPLSLPLNRGIPTGELRWRTFVFLACILAIHRCFSLVFFSSISVATNRTVPVSDRAAMNGLSVLGGSGAKALGPTFAGTLTTVSVKWLGKYASLAMFGSIGVLGLCVMAASFFVLHDDEAIETASLGDKQETQAHVQIIELGTRDDRSNKQLP